MILDYIVNNNDLVCQGQDILCIANGQTQIKCPFNRCGME